MRLDPLTKPTTSGTASTRGTGRIGPKHFFPHDARLREHMFAIVDAMNRSVRACRNLRSPLMCRIRAVPIINRWVADSMIDALSADLRLAVRRLRASPWFCAVFIVTCTLAIAANTTVFSLLNAIVLRPIAVPNANRLVSISATDLRTNETGFIYVDTFNAFRAQQRSLSHLSMLSAGGFRIEAGGTSFDVGVEGITAAYFDALGVRPSAGRLLTEADQASSGAGVPVAVISDRVWQRLFGRDPHAIGETMKIDGKPTTIIGVTPPGFTGLQADLGADLFIPLSTLRTLWGDTSHPLRARYTIGVLAPGVSLAQARAEVVARWPAIQAATVPASLPEAEQRSLQAQRVQVESTRAGFSLLRRQYGSSLLVLVGMTATFLAIGCVNLAGLVLVRAMRQRHEMAVRLALGGSRARLVQQVLAETLILTLGGLAAALPVAWWSSRAITEMMSVARSASLRPMTPDGRVLIVAVIATVSTAVLISLLASWRSMRAPLDADLRRGRTIAGSLGRSGQLLIVGQVALSMALLISAGLFVRTLAHLRANDRPVRNRQIVWTRLARNSGDRTILGRTYWQELVRQLSTIRAADAAALSTYFPAFLGYPGALPTDDYALASNPSLVAPALTELVSPGFFDTFGISRLRGRDFTWDDDEDAPAVAIVSQSAAQKFSPSGNIIGRRLRLGSGPTRLDVEVVGVVADAPIGVIREPHQPVVFRPLLQNVKDGQFPLAHVRISGDVRTVSAEYVRVVQAQGHRFVRALFTFEQWIDYSLLQERLIAGASTCAAALAVLLGCIGVYALLAYAVVTRGREIAIRMAIGATRGMVTRMIVRDGLQVVVPGIVLGVLGAIAAGRVIQSHLYGLRSNDSLTIIVAAGVFLATGLLAAVLPARRASNVNPIDTLRLD